MQDVGSFLHQVQESWTTHCSQMVLIRNVFLYMDRTYVRDTQDVKPLWCVKYMRIRTHTHAQLKEHCRPQPQPALSLFLLLSDFSAWCTLQGYGH